jgi:DNA-binding winged helix-turn-helix (wHTH) protein
MMASPHQFGDFELDPSRFELRRNDRVVKLERIPMELLILLLERQGSVVSRQEIVDRL